MRRTAALLTIVLLMATALGATAAPTVASGDLVFDSDRAGAGFEIYSMHADGSGAKRLTRNGARWDSWWPQISPDRKTIVFQRTPKGVHDNDFTKVSIWAMAADGTRLRQLRAPRADGWELQGHVEWSPDGKQLVLFGGPVSGPQLFTTGADGKNPVPVAARAGNNIDPSWANDGSILFAGCATAYCPQTSLEIFKVPASGAPPVRLSTDTQISNDPALSPDGSTLAWLTEVSTGVWDILVAPPGGTPRRLIGDKNVASKPAWSLDGKTIYFHRLIYGNGQPFEIWAAAPDGSGLRNLTATAPGSNEFPSA